MPPPTVSRTKTGSVAMATSGTQSPLSRSPGTKSPQSKSPNLKPLTQATPVPPLSTEGHDALAEAISKIDSLRMSQPPSASSTPPDSNAATSNPASRRASQVALGSSFSEKRFYSPPVTPHFGAQTNLCVLRHTRVADPVWLRELDDSTKVIRASRESSDGLKRAPSVSGIGGVGEFT